jgi:hypothetical protein
MISDTTPGHLPKGILANKNACMPMSEGKWIQLEDITLSEVSHIQKDKGHIFSLICGRQIQKINIHKNKHDRIQTQL